MNDYTNIGRLGNIITNFHVLMERGELVDRNNDPYYHEPEDGGCRCYPNSRKYIVEYFKYCVANKEFIEKICSDDFLNIDDPEYKKEQIRKDLSSNGYDKDVLKMLTEVINKRIEVDYTESSTDDDLKTIIDTSSDYIILFDDSGRERIWFKTTDSLDIVKFIIKTEHRKCIGCGCNKYVHMIIQNKKSVHEELIR